MTRRRIVILVLLLVMLPAGIYATVARGGEAGDAVAASADGETWFVYDPDLTQDGLWTIAREEPPELAAITDGEASRRVRKAARPRACASECRC